jgi:hypothetical protein
MAVRLAGIGPFRWGIWPGKGWRRSRGLPWTGLWPQTSAEAPVAGRPAAHKGTGRSAPGFGGCSGLGGGTVALGGTRGC